MDLLLLETSVSNAQSFSSVHVYQSDISQSVSLTKTTKEDSKMLSLRIRARPVNEGNVFYGDNFFIKKN